MVKINIVGGIGGTTGYNRHITEFAKAIHRLNPEISIETSVPNNYENLFESEIVDLIRADYKEGINIFIGLPHYLPIKLAEKNKEVIPFVVFEGDKIPKQWERILNDERIKLIFVPSNHVKLACLNSGVKKRIEVISEGVDFNKFKPSEPLKELKTDKFTFLFVGGWAQGENDRKDVATLLRAYTEEFTDKDNVNLILKINTTYNPNMNIDQELLNLNLKTENRPKFTLITQTFDDLTLAKLYSTADCFVCPSRAEGFGLIFAEAMACGLPCITTNFGGQTDFINQFNGFLISGEMINATDFNPMYEGIKWLKPSLEQLKNTMRFCYSNPEEVKKYGKLAKKDIQDFTWNNAAKKALGVINEINRE